MTIWKNKSKTERLKYFVEDFIIFIKQCYHIVWSIEKIQSKNPKVVKTKNGRIMLLSTCAVCYRKKNWNLSKSKKLVGY